GGGRGGGGKGPVFGSVLAPGWRSGLTECDGRDKASEEKETACLSEDADGRQRKQLVAIVLSSEAAPAFPASQIGSDTRP
ncbi:hypothetical protein D4764_03G0009550, partial [Takifugu flavidus]